MQRLPAQRSSALPFQRDRPGEIPAGHATGICDRRNWHFPPAGMDGAGRLGAVLHFLLRVDRDPGDVLALPALRGTRRQPEMLGKLRFPQAVALPTRADVHKREDHFYGGPCGYI